MIDSRQSDWFDYLTWSIDDDESSVGDIDSVIGSSGWPAQSTNDGPTGTYDTIPSRDGSFRLDWDFSDDQINNPEIVLEMTGPADGSIFDSRRTIWHSAIISSELTTPKILLAVFS